MLFIEIILSNRAHILFCMILTFFIANMFFLSPQLSGCVSSVYIWLKFYFFNIVLFFSTVTTSFSYCNTTVYASYKPSFKEDNFTQSRFQQSFFFYFRLGMYKLVCSRLTKFPRLIHTCLCYHINYNNTRSNFRVRRSWPLADVLSSLLGLLTRK